MHRAAYAALGLRDWRYDAIDVEEHEVAGFVTGLDPSWRGLSVTMPLKRAVIAALDAVGGTATRVGAVNTVTFEAGRRRGENTDVPGAVAAVREQGVEAVDDAVVLGAGATATSLVAALVELGLTRATVVARDVTRADPLARLARSWGVSVSVEPFDSHVRRGHVDVVVSTVPSDAVHPVAPHLVRDASLVFDALYDPWPTALVAAARDQAVPVVTGLDLLAHQAVLQVELMTGGSVSAELLRTAARNELASR